MAREHTILAIDPGSKCGWALWRDDFPNPIYGTWRFEWGTDGQRLLGLQRKIKLLDQDHGGLTQVVHEHNPNTATSERARVLGYGFLAAASIYCAARRIPFVTRTTGAGWRTDFVGRQNKLLIEKQGRQLAKQTGRSVDNRDRLKLAVIERCKQIGWNPQDAEQGDALGILDSFLRGRQIQAPWHVDEVLRAPLGAR